MPDFSILVWLFASKHSKTIQNNIKAAGLSWSTKKPYHEKFIGIRA